MGIDGIGKKGGVQPGAPDATEQPKASQPKETSFRDKLAAINQASSVQATAPTQGAGAVGQRDLDEVRQGRMSVDAYLDRKVDQAVAPISGLPSHEMDAIRKSLRSSLLNDPELRSLAEQATGKTLPADDA
jgi:hypothetical protein